MDASGHVGTRGGFDDVVGHEAHHVDAEVMVFRVVSPYRANAARWGPWAGRGDQFEGDAFAALRLGYFGVPEGEPAVEPSLTYAATSNAARMRPAPKRGS
jgi:hypothetical protein